MSVELIKQAYNAEEFYVVISSDGIFFSESPEEQGLTEDEVQESLLRLFVSREEADAYCDFVKVSYGDVYVTPVTLKDVWYLLSDIEDLSSTMFNCPVRIAVCKLDEDSWPVEIDILHSAFILLN